MTTSELRKLLRRKPVPQDAVVLDGEPRDETYVLSHDGDAWSVFYSERGLRTEERTFATESEACVELYRRLSRDFAFDT